MQKYFDIAFTPEARQIQEQRGSRDGYAKAEIDWPVPSQLNTEEVSHITSRNSLYMASVGSTGWPYVQHRGGDNGFIKVLGPTTIGWVERNGNRQYVGTGNITADDRVALILVDYPTRTRLKIYGHARHVAEPDAELLAALDATDVRHDGVIVIEVAAYDWNCPKYITQRFTTEEIADIVGPLHNRIAELEAQLASCVATPSPPGYQTNPTDHQTKEPR